MRTRVALVGVVVVALAGCGKESLPKLPVGAGAGDERGAAPAAAMPVSAQLTRYRVVADLPDLPDAAPAYSLSVDDAKAAQAAVARALLTGEDHVWVTQQPGRPWQVSGARDMPVSSDAACPPCPPDADCPGCRSVPRAPGLLSKEAAEHRAREILGRLGVAGGPADVRETPVSVEVTIRPEVAGLPTIGYEHGLSLGVEGVVIGGYGWLGRPERLGEYPLVGPEEAVERLRTGFGLGPRTLRATVEPASPDGMVAHEVVLTGAEVVLQLVEGHLVPAYRFRVADGEGPVVVAVVDRLLTGLAPQGGPEPAPEPDPRPGAQACSGSASAVVDSGGDEPADAPLTVEVCGPEVAKVGEEVVFEVTATDPDAEIMAEGCAGPNVLFGDDTDPVAMGSCTPGCAAPLKKGSPGKLQRTYRHTYAKPGRYTARFGFQSQFCTEGSSRGEGMHTVTVR